MKLRIAGLSVGSLSVLAAAILFDARVALANHSPYHYALEWTSVVQGFYRHDSAGPLVDAYFGWRGISGRIIAPETVPAMNDCRIDHENGAVVAYHARGTIRSVLIAIGWYTGTLGDCSLECIRRGGSPSTDCWRVWLNGSVRASQCALQFPTTAAMLAGTEILNRSKQENPQAPSINMPLSRYGSANLSETSSLKVLGVNGWEPWDTSLTAGFTSRYDESTGQENGIAPRYVISVDNAFYNFVTYRQ
ncbi:MAG TPA: hypothetical protein VM841_06970 [Actinomycetota bacterium]|nr:hypothetical protein [Actinomycetota bacterium]